MDGCTSEKIGFTSREAARRFRATKRTKGARMRIYRCPDCGDFHLTSQRR